MKPIPSCGEGGGRRDDYSVVTLIVKYKCSMKTLRTIVFVNPLLLS